MAYDAPTLERLLDDLGRAHMGRPEHRAYLAMNRAIRALIATTTDEAARHALADLWRAAHVTPTGEIDIFIPPNNVFLEAVLAFCEQQPKGSTRSVARAAVEPNDALTGR